MTNFIISKDQLSKLIPNNPKLNEWYDALVKFLPAYQIDSVQRVAAFIAQCSHESGGFRTIKENLNYRADSLMRTWPSRFPTMVIAEQYARKPDAIANRAYASRMGNGDESSGDGAKFAGKGLIQLTGKNNYQAFATSVERDINDIAAYLTTVEGAAESACWFYKTNNLNKFADVDDIKGMTKVINGGYIGLSEREENYHLALAVLSK